LPGLGGNGIGSPPIAPVGLGGNGIGSPPIAAVGLGGNGIGSPPIATKFGLCAANVAFPANTRRTEMAVTTTSSARRNVRTRFFIKALLEETQVPAPNEPGCRKAYALIGQKSIHFCTFLRMLKC
jgi:hypothetical protein